jgi:dienelactone hydrolase
VAAAERIGMTEADDGHGYTLPRREAAYRWFGKWLKGAEDTAPEQEVVPALEEDLFCTPTGQVATSLGGETVFTLNKKRLAEVRAPFSSAAQVRDFIGYQARLDVPARQSYGRVERKGYSIEKMVVAPEPGIKLPALVYRGEGGGARPGVVLASSRGKAAAHDDAERLALAGNIVLSVDLRGWGEGGTQSERNGSDWPRYFGDFESAMTAMLTGKPLVAMRAEDVSSAVSLLASLPGVDATRLAAFGKDGAGVPVLYAAALDDRIKRVWLERMLASYESVIDSRIHKLQWENSVRGALRHYDLPRLAQWVAESREVRVADPTDALGQLMPVGAAAKLYGRVPVVRRRGVFP